MNDFVKNVNSQTLSDGFGLVQRHSFELKRRNGEWQHQVRETYDRGDGAAVLLCDFAAGSVVLIRQFRYPAYYRGENPFVIEVCAGKLEGDDPERCARKEAEEETGLRVGKLDRAYTTIMSPGSVTERLTLFIGAIDGQVGTGGGLHDEGEDIEILTLPFWDAMAMVERGEISDAKTVLLLQYAALKGLFGDNPA